MSLLTDVRFGLRTLAKNPVFTLVAVIALSLGIGVNAIVFTLTNTVILKGFPFDKNDRIVYMGSRNVTRSDQFGPVSYADFRDWRKQARSFVGMAAASGAQVNLTDNNGLPETHRAAEMTANSFYLIGQKPLIGRDFRSEDEAIGAPQVMILTYGLWERRYGKDVSIIGRTVKLNGVPTTIIGVMPKGMTFPFDGDLWFPLVPTADSEKRELRNLIAFGRLAVGATLESARAEMETVAHNLATAYPVTNQNFAPVVWSYNRFYVGTQITTIFLAMLVAVSFVLLIACANVANLLLARAVSRSREISIRIAVGATRWRLVRQLLIESLILAAAAGVLGWLLGLWGVHIFDVVTTPFGKPSWMIFSMDYRVFAYLAAISLGSSLLFGLVPALRLSKLDILSGLKDGGRGASEGHHSKRLSSLLVIGEMALAIVLLAGAGLMIRSFLNVYRASLGVNTKNVLTLRLILPQAKYAQPNDQVFFHEHLKTSLESIPGVERVAIANFLPTGGSTPIPYEFEGAPVDASRRATLSAVVITSDYFRVMGVAALQGRFFTDSDGVAGPQVAIVNQRFAAKFWPGEDPLGKRLRLFSGATAQPWLTVVGVVPNIVQNDIAPRQIDPLIYLPYRERPQADMAVVALTRVPPVTLGTAFRREIQSIDPDLPIYNLWTMQQRLERNYWFYRAMGVLFVVFAGIALLLASIGLYAVMANSVGQRTQEMGLRMALGATARNLLRLVFVTGMRQVAIGLAIGALASFAMMRVLKSALVAVSPADPATFVIATAMLVLAAALGCYIPARRAMRVDPLVALRHE